MRSYRIALLATLTVAVLLASASMAAAIPVDWEEHGDNPVFDPDGRAYYPDVLFSATGFDGHGPAYRYKMWYDDGADTWLAYSNDGESWTRLGSSPVVVGYRHPQVAYDEDHFGDSAGDRIQSAFPETYLVTPYYKMWLWDMYNGSRVMFAYSADGETWRTDYPRDVLPHSRFPVNPGSPVYDLEVLYDGGTYCGWADNNGRMYNVSSSDGTTWTIGSVAVDLGGAG